ncbi:hypothetical protein BDQ17DRAFT_751600 [Cyathus striatus]|nr:hypothetical protein BDQ17DRAFT_751600 [Cyathus striatus]
MTFFGFTSCVACSSTRVSTGLYPHSPLRLQREQQRSMGVGIGLTAHVGAAAVGGLVDDWGAGGGAGAGGLGGGMSPALVRFKYSWEAFVDSLLREWKTLNLTSALLALYISFSFLSLH